MWTDENIAQGMPIYLNYGNLSNEILLKLYGFVIPPPLVNPYDSVRLYAALDASDVLYNEKSKLLTELDICYDGSQPFSISLKCYPTDLIVFVRIQLASDIGSLLELRSSCGKAIESDIGRELDLNTMNHIEAALRYMLNNYPYNFDADREVINPKSISSDKEGSVFLNPSQKEMSCVILRHSEMAILKTVIDRLRSVL